MKYKHQNFTHDGICILNTIKPKRLNELFLAINSEAYDEEEIKRSLNSDEIKLLILIALDQQKKESLDMSDADCFSVERLHQIIYGSKLRGQEAKLLARFMHDVKQRTGVAS